MSIEFLIWKARLTGPRKVQGNFDSAFDFVVSPEVEGEYSNDPDDPGRETKWGISKRAYPHLVIKNVSLADAKRIYLEDYWIKAGCDNLPSPLDICVFDCAVNQGVARAVHILADSATWQEYLLNRLTFYQRLGNRKFFSGWCNRVINLYNRVR